MAFLIYLLASMPRQMRLFTFNIFNEFSSVNFYWEINEENILDGETEQKFEQLQGLYIQRRRSVIFIPWKIREIIKD